MHFCTAQQVELEKPRVIVVLCIYGKWKQLFTLFSVSYSRAVNRSAVSVLSCPIVAGLGHGIYIRAPWAVFFYQTGTGRCTHTDISKLGIIYAGGGGAERAAAGPVTAAYLFRGGTVRPASLAADPAGRGHLTLRERLIAPLLPSSVTRHRPSVPEDFERNFVRVLNRIYQTIERNENRLEEQEYRDATRQEWQQVSPTSPMHPPLARVTIDLRRHDAYDALHNELSTIMPKHTKCRYLFDC